MSSYYKNYYDSLINSNSNSQSNSQLSSLTQSQLSSLTQSQLSPLTQTPVSSLTQSQRIRLAGRAPIPIDLKNTIPQMDNSLIVNNNYNDSRLWREVFPAGYGVFPDEFIGNSEYFYSVNEDIKHLNNQIHILKGRLKKLENKEYLNLDQVKEYNMLITKLNDNIHNINYLVYGTKEDHVIEYIRRRPMLIQNRRGGNKKKRNTKKQPLNNKRKRKTIRKR